MKGTLSCYIKVLSFEGPSLIRIFSSLLLFHVLRILFHPLQYFSSFFISFSVLRKKMAVDSKSMIKIQLLSTQNGTQRVLSPFPFSVRKIKRPKNASYKGYFSDDLHFSDAGVRKIQVSGLFFGRFSIFRTTKGKEA